MAYMQMVIKCMYAFEVQRVQYKGNDLAHVVVCVEGQPPK